MRPAAGRPRPAGAPPPPLVNLTPVRKPDDEFAMQAPGWQHRPWRRVSVDLGSRDAAGAPGALHPGNWLHGPRASEAGAGGCPQDQQAGRTPPYAESPGTGYGLLS